MKKSKANYFKITKQHFCSLLKLKKFDLHVIKTPSLYY